MLLTQKQRAACLAMGLALGLTLAWGFLPTVKTFQLWLEALYPPLWERSHLVVFPILAGAFCVSLPRPKLPPRALGRGGLTVALPLAVAWLYGWVTGIPSLWDAYHSPQRDLLFWAILGAPIGEELLFRGWVYRLAYRLWGNRWPTAASPLPGPVWVSALAFALWHVQNLSIAPVGAVTFQVVSTFLAGIWLAQLYRMTGSLLAPILGHIGINAACYGFLVHSTDLLK